MNTFHPHPVKNALGWLVLSPLLLTAAYVVLMPVIAAGLMLYLYGELAYRALHWQLDETETSVFCFATYALVAFVIVVGAGIREKRQRKQV